MHTSTPLHDPTHTSGYLDFLDQPRAQGKRSVRRNRDPEYAYLFMSRREITTPDYSGARHDDIWRQQSRRARVPPLGVDLNAYYGIGDQIIVVTAQARAMIVLGRTGTLYFYHEEVGGFVNVYGEAELSYWTQETPQVATDVTRPSLIVDLEAYPTAATERRWFLLPEATLPIPTGTATLPLVIANATEHYSLMPNTSFASA